MYVSHLALNDYRSYREQVVELPASVVVLVGQNGRGKTNLVEALAYLSTFSSHRVSSSSALVRVAKEGEEQPGGAVVRARVQEAGRSSLLELEIARGRANRGRLNKSNVAPRELLGRLRTVVFAPEDLELLRGDPSTRRRFLDEIVTKLRPHFLGVRQDFDRVLRQRGATLKQLGRSGRGLSPEDEAILEVWDRQLAELSATIVIHRQAVVAALQPLVTQAYNEITTGDRDARISYRSHLAGRGSGHGSTPGDEEPQNASGETETPLSAGIEVVGGRIEGDAEAQIAALTEDYVVALRQIRDKELRRGVNLEGAHRDDLLVTLDGLPVKGYASHGELWSSALMLRLAELQLLRLDNDYPVLILDDVFAELDTSRRRGLLEEMAKVEQVIITVAVEGDIPENLNAHKIRVFRDEEGLSQTEVIPAKHGDPEVSEVGVETRD